MLSAAKLIQVNQWCSNICSTLILCLFLGTSTDLQCDQCQKSYCSKSSLNHHKKTQHKQIVLLWKLDGEQIEAPSNSSKEIFLGVECDIKQQSIVGSNSFVKEVANDLIN